MLSRLRAGAVAFASVLVLAGIPVAIPAADPFEINAVLSMTGQGGFLGKNSAITLGVIEAVVNKAGGIDGRPIKFTIHDDRSNAQDAVQLMAGITAQHVSAVLGTTLVGSCNAMMPLLVNGPVVFCFSAGVHPDKGSYMFAYGGNTATYAHIMLRYLRDRGWKRLAMISGTDASSKDLETAYDTWLKLPEFKDLVLVDWENFAPNDISMTAQLAKVKAIGAQVLIANGTGTPIGTVFNSMKSVGLDVPTVVSASNFTYAEMKQFEKIVPAQLFAASPPCLAVGVLPNGPTKDACVLYVDSLKAAGQAADISYSVAYDPAMIVVNAYKKLGLGASASQIKNYIAGLHDWYGSVGRYDFRDGTQKGSTEESTVIVRWDPDKSDFVGVSKLGGALH
jgi:branched-chain amino acid transport system substrate-binding protein